MRIGTVIGLGLLGLIWAGCGGDDEGKKGGGGYNAIAASIAEPTGTLETSNAVEVATEFEKISTSSPGGQRLLAGMSTTQTIACPYGGTYGVSSSGGPSSAEAVLSYNDCCYATDCCFNGGGTWYYSLQGGALFNYCGSYDVSTSCLDSQISLSYEGCLGSDGWVYVVVVGGKTYSVTGNFNAGTGTLTVRAANGSYTCRYTSYKGTCTGTSGSFTF